MKGRRPHRLARVDRFIIWIGFGLIGPVSECYRMVVGVHFGSIPSSVVAVTSVAVTRAGVCGTVVTDDMMVALGVVVATGCGCG